MAWRFDERVWVKKWGFSRREIRLLRPVAAQLERYGHVPDLERHLGVLETHFHRTAYTKRRDAARRELAQGGETLANVYYGIMEPVNFFHELWLYQHFKARDTPKPCMKVFQEHGAMIAQVVSAASPLSDGLKERIKAEFKKLTTRKELGAELEFIELAWSPEQIRLIESRLGRRGMVGKKSPERTHRWDDAKRILSAHLKARKVPNYRMAAYRFLNLVFPDFVRWYPTSQARKDFMRHRRKRLSTKSGGTAG